MSLIPKKCSIPLKKNQVTEFQIKYIQVD